MNIAQQLYEAGLITYMRTDSVTLSNLALNAAKEFITKNYGEKYYKRRQYKNKVKGAQEAHEAIRPTDLSKSTIEATQQMKRLYELIWRRTIASQMSDAEFIRATISIASDQNKHLFLAKSETLTFDGYLKIYQEKDDDDDVKEITSAIDISKFKIDDRLDFKDITAKQSFTNPPYHYNEAALVKKLEELGIGRPSTYATIITTIQQRDYVDKRSIPAKERNIKIYTLDNSKKIKDTEKKEKYGGEKQKLISTELGKVVTDFLMKHFPDIMDYNFTAEIEERFDKIALGQEEWQDMLRDFYKDFHPKVLEAIETSSKQHISRLLGVDPKTNKNVYITYTKHGMALQLGDYTDNEKPSYVSINKRQNIDFNKITLEEALKFFELPKELGDYQGSKVVVNIGRYGPYVLYKDKFYSIKKLDKPLTEFTLDEAIEIIKQPTGLIKTISEKPLIQLLIGRYGPYIKTDDGNIPIPKGTDINTITDDEIKFIIENHKTKKKMKELQYLFEPCFYDFSFNNHKSHLYSNVITIDKLDDKSMSDINSLAIINFSINTGKKNFINSLYKLRSYLYSYRKIDNVQIIDLGTFINNTDAFENINGLAYVLSDLLLKGALPIILSDDRSVVLAIHKAYELIKRFYNLAFILPFIDVNADNLWEQSKDLLPWHNEIFKDNNLLNNATFIGYQSYLTDNEALEWVENNFYDTLRLGDIRENIKATEPYIRNSDIVCFDLNAMKKLKPQPLCSLYQMDYMRRTLPISFLCWYV